MKIPPLWLEELKAETCQPYFRELVSFLEVERESQTVFPPIAKVFHAFELTSPAATNVLILGQDPYHNDGQAHGLCFSVNSGVRLPPSLRNIFRELEADQGVPMSANGNLTPWAQQGVLLLNTILTVRAHEPQSHRKRGWERFTDAVIQVINEKPTPVIFVLWGNSAREKKKKIDLTRHVVIESAHPSPLSARRGFMESRPFAQINAALRSQGKPTINWQLPSEPTV